MHLNSILELKKKKKKKRKKKEERIEKKDAYALFNFAAYSFHYIVSSPLTT